MISPWGRQDQILLLPLKLWSHNRGMPDTMRQDKIEELIQGGLPQLLGTKTKRMLSLEGMNIEEGTDSLVCLDTSARIDTLMGIEALARRHLETQRRYQHHSRRIYRWVFELGQKTILESKIRPYHEQLGGFLAERIDTRGYIDLLITFGDPRALWSISVHYLVVEVDTSYNVLINRPTLNTLGGIVSTPHLVMNFSSSNDQVVIVKADHKMAW
ncbi:hypothetical protein CR513_52531, partial [Mucuna pruriens]